MSIRESADAASGSAAAIATSDTAGARPGHERAVKPEAAAPLTAEELLRFDCLRGARYHEDRQRHFERLHRLVMFVSALAGTAAVGGALSVVPELTVVAGTIVSALTTFDLVYDLTGEARRHEMLKIKTCETNAALEEGGDPAHLRAALMRAYAEEPPAMHAVNALAFNAAVDAIGLSKDQKIGVGFRTRIFRHWCAFDTLDPNRTC